MKSKTLPPLDDVKKHLKYNPENGELIWRVSLSNRAVKGRAAGSVNKFGRLYVGFQGRDYLGYRLAWLLYFGEEPCGMIDHIDGNPSNNRLSNLRYASKSLNQQNVRKARSNNTSGLLGVSWSKKDKRFKAQITANGKYKCVGYFKTADEAYAAYINAKRVLHEGCTI